MGGLADTDIAAGKDNKDLSGLGLKCGLEIHQQLNTAKLFCSCPSVVREDKPDLEIVRALRASAGETGEVDAAAKHEQVKAKRFRYQGYHDTTCLVELDEEPPHLLNEQALETTLQVAKLLGSQILGEVHVMRKTVIDGSNTSGFQRTALIALGGRLHEQPVRIQTVCLEEDACKLVARAADEDIYNLSRLGIPLIEIATEPDISSPEQAQATAAEIGMILRSTGNCKRGLGTIRQDINVSIKGGSRVEIKGAQDLRLLPELVRNEALRQHGLLRIKDELVSRGVTSMLLPSPQDLTRIFHRTTCGFMMKGIGSGDAVVGVCLPRFRSLLGVELLPSHRLGTELAGYAHAIGFGGIIHSDEDLQGKYTFSEIEIGSARHALGCAKEDAFILVLGDKLRIEEFFAFLLVPRLEQLLHGVPNEVRKANPDGTSTFMRPMPGAARMYPETDIRRVITHPEKVHAPKLLKEQEADLVKLYKIVPSHAKELLRDGWEFEWYARAYKNLPPAFLATTLLDAPKEIWKRYAKELSLTEHEETLRDILGHADRGVIPKEGVFELLVQLAEGKRPDYGQFSALSDEEVERTVLAVIKVHPSAPLNGLMGEAMARLRGKASGQRVMELLRKHTTK